MKKRTQRKKTQEPLIDLLTRTLKGKNLAAGPGPNSPASGKVVGVIKNPVAKALFQERVNALDALAAYQKRGPLMEQNRYVSLARRADALSFIVDEIVATEFPIVSNPTSNPVVSAGWEVNVSPEILMGVPFEDASSPSRRLFADIGDALTRPQASRRFVPNDPVKSSDKVVGAIADKRIRALFALLCALDACVAAAKLPENAKEMNAWVVLNADRTISWMVQNQMQYTVIEEQASNLRTLLFTLIRESLPSKVIKESAVLAVRKGWTVVSVAAESVAVGADALPKLAVVLCSGAGVARGVHKVTIPCG